MSNMNTTIVTHTNTMSLSRRFIWSAIGAVIFALVSLPQVYMQTSRVYTTTVDTCPTAEGKYIHAVLFFAISYFVMKIAATQNWLEMNPLMSNGLIAKYAFYETLLFFVLASSDTYALTGRMISDVTDELGCPDMKGVMVNAVIFLVILFFMMYFPKDMC